jgi:hypothetical protein
MYTHTTYRAGRKKPAGNAWGGDSGNRDKTLPYLDAVVVTPSSQPPNLSKIPAVAAAKGGAKGGAKGAVAPKPAGATAAASAKAAGAAAAAANRKRKAPSTASTSAASTKGGAPVAKKRATKPTKGAAANVKADADASLMELSSAELGEENEAAAALGGDGDDDEEQDEAHIKEVEVPCNAHHPPLLSPPLQIRTPALQQRATQCIDATRARVAHRSSCAPSRSS